MKWKSDTIEQFVKYKIQHPEESYQLLRNYQLEQKQNQHLDKMYKQLQQLKISRDYFLHQLHKLNKITQNQGQKNLQDIQDIDRKCEIVAQKLQQMKFKKKNEVKRTKSQIISEYQNQIKTMTASFQNQLNQQQQKINKVKTQLQQLNFSGKTHQLKQKITQTKSSLQFKKAQCGEREQKIKLIKKLQQQLSQKCNTIEEKQNHIKKLKQQSKQRKRKQAQTQLQSYYQMKKRIQKEHQQIVNQIKSKLIAQSSTITSFTSLTQLSPLKKKQTFKQRPNSMEQKSTTDNQISQQLLFNPHIDFSYTKKSKNFSPVKKPQQIKIEESQQKVQEIQQNIDLFKKFIEQLKSQYEIDLQQTQQNKEKEASQYLLTKYSHSSQKLHTYLESMIQSLKQKINERRIQSDKLFSQQNQKLIVQESKLNKKQKQLDKEIQHLQNKVQKTQNQITKKNRVSV